MSTVRVQKEKSILLAQHSENSYLDPQAPIFLLPNGDVQCGSEIYKANPQVKHQYPFIRDYLKKKRLPFDISAFQYKNLVDVIDDMQNNSKHSISLNKLRDIIVFNNQIAKIKEYKVKKIKYIAYLRFCRKRKQLMKEKKYKEINEQQRLFQERQFRFSIARHH